ncbi:MAG: hypothetical protein HQM16_14080 [Deltaproteobacteria bacterium]|nr:hypothetical protein [Deltaproteobacteria bacterium]
MKEIIIDAGRIYTKVVVLESTEDGATLRGRAVFPSLAVRVKKVDKKIIYYRHADFFYAAGYDCVDLKLEFGTNGTESRFFVNGKRRRAVVWTGMNPGDKEGSGQYLRLMMTKVLLDFCEDGERVVVTLLFDSAERLEFLQEITADLNGREVALTALRGLDQCQITKRVGVNIWYLSSADAVLACVRRVFTGFQSVLAVDIGYGTTKVYLADGEKGVDVFGVLNCGISSYYEKIIRLLREKGVRGVNFFWLLKQVEAGLREIEVKENKGHNKKDFNISLVIDDVRWELNKGLKREIADMAMAHYTNTTQWADALFINGGGAAFSGELLHVSMLDDGLIFKNVFIDTQSVCGLVDGFVQEHLSR